ncbi:hypothetical protein IAR55_007212 [Kwoniella newhampshirensis]|uniref:Uncharacterized protein n=1 Tax=Kwoniella newhampshirensis TaxID=1651941 RepID=A0AAW0YCP6_9TREE
MSSNTHTVTINCTQNNVHYEGQLTFELVMKDFTITKVLTTPSPSITPLESSPAPSTISSARSRLQPVVEIPQRKRKRTRIITVDDEDEPDWPQIQTNPGWHPMTMEELGPQPHWNRLMTGTERFLAEERLATWTKHMKRIRNSNNRRNLREKKKEETAQ